MSLVFSALQLMIDGKNPSAEELKPAFGMNDNTHVSDDTYYLITTENLNDECLWIYARYGKSTPYSPTVYNKTDQKEESNPRSTEQLEPHKQLFALYSIKNGTLYLSNSKKKLWIQEWLKTKLTQDVVLKAFYKDVDEFIEVIKSVEKVKFIAKTTLFTEGGELMKIFPTPNDLYGLGMPDTFSLEANFRKGRLTARFIENLKKMVKWKDSCEADSILCIGRDDEDFETIFNVSTFIQKVTVAAIKDGQGRYDPTTVQQMLIRNIGGADEKSS